MTLANSIENRSISSSRAHQLLFIHQIPQLLSKPKQFSLEMFDPYLKKKKERVTETLTDESKRVQLTPPTYAHSTTREEELFVITRKKNTTTTKRMVVTTVDRL